MQVELLSLVEPLTVETLNLHSGVKHILELFQILNLRLHMTCMCLELLQLQKQLLISHLQTFLLLLRFFQFLPCVVPKPHALRLHQLQLLRKLPELLIKLDRAHRSLLPLPLNLLNLSLMFLILLLQLKL